MCKRDFWCFVCETPTSKQAHTCRMGGSLRTTAIIQLQCHRPAAWSLWLSPLSTSPLNPTLYFPVLNLFSTSMILPPKISTQKASTPPPCPTSRTVENKDART
mmetsp:Transcript_29185/g.52482  ORF Transcript_29185/g.52482 Transcript_29185/m.52482 type:complete len:103 (-) Transcript_29185:137-445(-)